MRILLPLALLACASAGSAGDSEQTGASRQFAVTSADGTEIRGVVDLPATAAPAAVIMVAGTGLVDRDVRLGRSNSPRDAFFADLSRRLTLRGLAVVRHDRRGAIYRAGEEPAVDTAAAASSTAESLRDDLRAIDDWTRSPAGLDARCVILFGHSEGVLHIARMAESGAPAPRLVIGVGAPMRSPAEVLYWQFAERAVYSFRLMDTDRNQIITEAEVQANWRRTPASGSDASGFPALPRGGLSLTMLEWLGRFHENLYDRAKTAALALDDAEPYPSAAAPVASASWWKGWFTDDRPVAERLAAWPMPVSLHYGDIDSQTPPHLDAPAALAALGARLTVRIHSARGHSLGEHALLGPMDEAIADSIADEIAAAARSCSS